MGFKAFQTRVEQDGAVRLSDPIPMRFSGSTGLVALWYRANRDIADRPWKVAAVDWLALALSRERAEECWLVLEQEEDGVVVYSRLLSISGVAARRIEIMFTFAPLIARHDARGIEVRMEETSRLWTEELALDGGSNVDACTWRWSRPHLALGAAILRNTAAAKKAETGVVEAAN